MNTRTIELGPRTPTRYHMLCYECRYEEESTDRHTLVSGVDAYGGALGCVHCGSMHVTLTRTETMIHRPSAHVAMPHALKDALARFLISQPSGRLFEDDEAQKGALVEALTRAALGVLAAHPNPQEAK